MRVVIKVTGRKGGKHSGKHSSVMTSVITIVVRGGNTITRTPRNTTLGEKKARSGGDGIGSIMSQIVVRRETITCLRGSSLIGRKSMGMLHLIRSI